MRRTLEVVARATENPRCLMTDPRKHNYWKKLMKLVEQEKLPLGRIQDVDIYHDDRCRIYRGGYCNCDPEIKLRPWPEQN
jgi:hypothetical protein